MDPKMSVIMRFQCIYIVIRSKLLWWHNTKVTNDSVLYFHVGYASTRRPYEWHLIHPTACSFAPNVPATVVRGSKARMSIVSYANSALAILPVINRWSGGFHPFPHSTKKSLEGQRNALLVGGQVSDVGPDSGQHICCSHTSRQKIL